MVDIFIIPAEPRPSVPALRLLRHSFFLPFPCSLRRLRLLLAPPQRTASHTRAYTKQEGGPFSPHLTYLNAPSAVATKLSQPCFLFPTFSFRSLPLTTHSDTEKELQTRIEIPRSWSSGKLHRFFCLLSCPPSFLSLPHRGPSRSSFARFPFLFAAFTSLACSPGSVPGLFPRHLGCCRWLPLPLPLSAPSSLLRVAVRTSNRVGLWLPPCLGPLLGLSSALVTSPQLIFFFFPSHLALSHVHFSPNPAGPSAPPIIRFLGPCYLISSETVCTRTLTNTPRHWTALGVGGTSFSFHTLSPGHQSWL